MRDKERPRVYVTRRELEWLNNFRRRAIKRCPNLKMQRDIRDKVVPFPWKISTQISRSTAQGRLRCRVTIVQQDGPARYKADRIYDESEPSTSGRYIELRGVSGTNTM